jgi:hypothetical protein
VGSGGIGQYRLRRKSGLAAIYWPSKLPGVRFRPWRFVGDVGIGVFVRLTGEPKVDPGKGL